MVTVEWKERTCERCHRPHQMCFYEAFLDKWICDRCNSIFRGFWKEVRRCDRCKEPRQTCYFVEDLDEWLCRKCREEAEELGIDTGWD